MTKTGADTANPLAVQGDTARSRASLCGSYLPTFRPLAADVLQMAPALRREWPGWPMRPAAGTTPVTESHPGRGCRQILYLRENYHFGAGRIADYLKRFHQLSIATSSVHRILERHGMSRLPANQKHRPHKQRWQRYEKPNRVIGCRWTSSSSSASQAPGGASFSLRPLTIAPAFECSRSTIGATKPRRSSSSTRCGGGYPSGYSWFRPTTARSSSRAFTGISKAWTSATPTSARARRT